jgi:hypothetical protein
MSSKALHQMVKQPERTAGTGQETAPAAHASRCKAGGKRHGFPLKYRDYWVGTLQLERLLQTDTRDRAAMPCRSRFRRLVSSVRLMRSGNVVVLLSRMYK